MSPWQIRFSFLIPSTDFYGTDPHDQVDFFGLAGATIDIQLACLSYEMSSDHLHHAKKSAGYCKNVGDGLVSGHKPEVYVDHGYPFRE